MVITSLNSTTTALGFNRSIAALVQSVTGSKQVKPIKLTRFAKAPKCRHLYVMPCHDSNVKCYQHKPYDVLDYDLDYSKFLVDGDKVASYEAHSGKRKLSAYAVDNVVKVWVSVGEVEERVFVRIVSEYGVNKEFELRVRVRR